jgi:hypothetical protein
MIRAMDKSDESPRISLIRDSVVFQAKLLVDGFRDALLIPIALMATVVGLFRGGQDCDRHFKRVIHLGRRSERWIDLFGQHESPSHPHPAASMDRILNQVESVLRDQYSKGRSADEAREAVSEALKKDTAATGNGETQ